MTTAIARLSCSAKVFVLKKIECVPNVDLGGTIIPFVSWSQFAATIGEQWFDVSPV